MHRALLLILLATCTSLVIASRLRVPRFRPPINNRLLKRTIREDLKNKCQEKWRNATLDNFSWATLPKGTPATFPQRYFICDHYWRPSSDGSMGPIFLYLGNEANVELYLNNTGLMWESAPDFGALLVFIEHRYYGESKPFPPKLLSQNMHYLSAEQAMADYAAFLMELKAQLPAAAASPVIGFGGSYGGMLAAWFRMKYPHLLDGAIAASAPIWNFMYEVPEFDAGAFAKGVTYDASRAGGSDPHCADNVRAGWKVLEQLGATPQGRASLRASIDLCPKVKLDSPSDVLALRDWLSSAWDYMAMGDFPYPSGYMLNGNGVLPAFPVRVACSFMAAPAPSDLELMTGAAAAAMVFYNYSGTLTCLDYTKGANPETDEDSDFWGYQYCTEMFMPFARDGVSDMFWRDDFDVEATMEGCREQWGVTPRPSWATQEWGGRRIEAHSNIVFSNGLLDPWHGGGVLRDVSDTLVALIIPEGAHHLDLMFSHPDDPRSVTEARQEQREWISRWVAQARKARRGQAAAGAAGTASSHSSSHNTHAAGKQEEQQQQQGGIVGVLRAVVAKTLGWERSSIMRAGLF